MKLVQVDIDEIVIKRRVRRNLGDVGPLMKSIRAYGLINPIILTEKKELIAGQRRLEATKQLGWKTIRAFMVSETDELKNLELELEENLHRKDLTPDELAEGFMKMERLQNPGWFQRLWRSLVAFFAKLFRRTRK